MRLPRDCGKIAAQNNFAVWLGDHAINGAIGCDIERRIYSAIGIDASNVRAKCSSECVEGTPDNNSAIGLDDKTINHIVGTGIEAIDCL